MHPYGFSSTLRLVLLKNWQLSATCRSSTRTTSDRYVTFGVPSAAHVEIIAGNTP
jgi:hypothetical protein